MGDVPDPAARGLVVPQWSARDDRKAAVAGRGRRRGAGRLWASRRRALAEPRDGSRPRPGGDAVAVAAVDRRRRPDATAGGPLGHRSAPRWTTVGRSDPVAAAPGPGGPRGRVAAPSAGVGSRIRQ